MPEADRSQPLGARSLPVDVPAEGLGQRSARGAAWAVGGQLFTEPVRILGTAILARMLTPADFGLIGMAAVFFGLTAITTELGPSAAIIARKDLTDDEVSSLFWGSLGIGVLLTLIAVAAAPLVAAVYREPRVAPVFAALSFTVLLSAEALVHNALLRRRMDFRIPAIANMVAVTVNGVVSVAAALLGMGYWSLVVGTLAAVLTSVIIVQIGARFRPKLHFRWSEVKPFLSFSTTVTGAELANYGSSNVDNLLVGRMLGTGSLGFYALAYNLVTYPVRMFAALIAQVTLPALSRITDDAERFKAAYLRATGLSSSVVLPVLIVALVAAPDLVLGVYGDQWTGAVAPFQLLCLAGMARSVGVFARSAFKAAERPMLQLRWDIALLVGVAAGAYFGSPWGVAGVAAAVALATLAATIGIQWDISRLLKLTFGGMLRALAPAAVLASGAGAAAYGIAAGMHAVGAGRLLSAAVTVLGSLAVTWAWGRFAFTDVRDLEVLLGGMMPSKARKAAARSESGGATVVEDPAS
jgi:O-antigen/teichoic acid export membrane protein